MTTSTYQRHFQHLAVFSQTWQYDVLLLCTKFTPMPYYNPQLPVKHSLHIFDSLEPKFTPSSLSCAWNWPSKFASEGCVHPLKLCTDYCASAWKSGSSFPLWQNINVHAVESNLHQLRQTLPRAVYQQPGRTWPENEQGQTEGVGVLPDKKASVSSASW